MGHVRQMTRLNEIRANIGNAILISCGEAGTGLFESSLMPLLTSWTSIRSQKQTSRAAWIDILEAETQPTGGLVQAVQATSNHNSAQGFQLVKNALESTLFLVRLIWVPYERHLGMPM